MPQDADKPTRNASLRASLIGFYPYPWFRRILQSKNEGHRIEMQGSSGKSGLIAVKNAGMPKFSIATTPLLQQIHCNAAAG